MTGTIHSLEFAYKKGIEAFGPQAQPWEPPTAGNTVDLRKMRQLIKRFVGARGGGAAHPPC